MNEPERVSRDEWRAARMQLLAVEKEHTRRPDALAKARRDLPAVPVDGSYRFEGDAGEVCLAELFEGERQLLIYHFMFGTDWEEGCPSCSFWADGFDGLRSHLLARDTALACVSVAPIEKISAYRQRMGWSFPWVSDTSGFSRDFGVSFPEGAEPTTDYNYSGKPGSGELPGLSAFVRGEDGTILHTYSAYARGLEAFNPGYAMLDLTSLGRHEENLPWPMAWIRRHDQYEKGSA